MILGLQTTFPLSLYQWLHSIYIFCQLTSYESDTNPVSEYSIYFPLTSQGFSWASSCADLTRRRATREELFRKSKRNKNKKEEKQPSRGLLGTKKDFQKRIGSR